MAEINQNHAGFEKALEIIEESHKHVFVTGRAGTGKSTLLEKFRNQTAQRVAVLAPTGVAALNVKGETIHSFFGFYPNMSVEDAARQARRAKKRKDLYVNLDTIIIDEISMVRADLLDCVDVFMKTIRKSHLPFGGARLVCFGDMFQLPPVVQRDEAEQLRAQYHTPYFFGASVFQNFTQQMFSDLITIQLNKVFRQKDQHFVELLNGVRTKNLSNDQLSTLNTQVIDDPDLDSLPDKTLVITSTNAQAQRINTHKLGQIGARTATFKGKAAGDFNRSSYPTDLKLELKPGARVMMINNDADKRWVNGSMGTVTDILGDGIKNNGVMVKLDDGESVMVYQHTWEVVQNYFNQGKNSVEREVIGSFRQLPLKLAWAVTIHKSQGQTFDSVVIDMGRGAFATGQTYVALSRCRSLEGLYLTKPITHRDVQIDKAILEFLEQLEIHEV